MGEEDIEEIVNWCIVKEEHIPEFVKDTKELIRKVIKKNIRQAKQEVIDFTKEELDKEEKYRPKDRKDQQFHYGRVTALRGLYNKLKKKHEVE